MIGASAEQGTHGDVIHRGVVGPLTTMGGVVTIHPDESHAGIVSMALLTPTDHDESDSSGEVVISNMDAGEFNYSYTHVCSILTYPKISCTYHQGSRLLNEKVVENFGCDVYGPLIGVNICDLI